LVVLSFYSYRFPNGLSRFDVSMAIVSADEEKPTG